MSNFYHFQLQIIIFNQIHNFRDSLFSIQYIFKTEIRVHASNATKSNISIRQSFIYNFFLFFSFTMFSCLDKIIKSCNMVKFCTVLE